MLTTAGDCSVYNDLKGHWGRVERRIPGDMVGEEFLGKRLIIFQWYIYCQQTQLYLGVLAPWESVLSLG